MLLARQNMALPCSFAPQSSAAAPCSPLGRRHQSIRRPQRCCRTSAALPKAQPGFFDRTFEQEQLRSLLAQQPKQILLLVGPQNSGKTALLAEVLAQRAEDEVQVYLDGRSAELTSPDALVESLNKNKGALQQLWRSLKEDGKLVVGALFASAGLPAFLQLSDGETSKVEGQAVTNLISAVRDIRPSAPATVKSVVDLLILMCSEAKQTGSWPVFVVDEVNRLVVWREGDKASKDALADLLAFFVTVSKAQNNAHVILATSEYSFIEWLAYAVGRNFFEVQVVGNFPEADAREFFRTCMQQRQPEGAEQLPPLVDADWAQVYEVCGGNPKDLGVAATKVGVVGSMQEINWESVLRTVWRGSFASITNAADGGNGWSPRQYLTTVQLLLQSPLHAVPERELRRALGKDGPAALRAMVKHGLLGVRPPSEWARDLPGDAHGDQGETLIMPASTVDLYCMRRIFGEHGEVATARLQALQEGNAGWRWSEMAGAAVAEDNAIAKVQRDIERVEQAISENEQQQASVKAAKEEGWREELQRLGEDKKRLGKKEQSLREKELLLMRAQTGGA